MQREEVDRIYRKILGPFPERVPLNIEIVSEEDCGEFTRALLTWDNDARERVEGYLLRPAAPSGQHPAILAFHGHGNHYDTGKEETAGTPIPKGRNWCFGPDLARRGFVVLCGDALSFGKRASDVPRWEGRIYERVVAMRLLAEGRCMAAQYVWDAVRQCDVLATFDCVDPRRIGAIGLSMGSGHAWLAAAAEPRIRALVAMASFYTFDALYRPAMRHCFLNYLPHVLEYGVETYDLFGLIAPRPFLMINGLDNPQSDPPAVTRELYEKAKPAWRAEDAAEAFQLLEHPEGHVPPAEVIQRGYAWLEKWL